MHSPTATYSRALPMVAMMVALAVPAMAQATRPPAPPVILVDGAHHNLVPASGTVQYLEGLGCVARELTGPIDRTRLAGADILLVPMALAERNALPAVFDTPLEELQARRDRAFTLPSPSAFSSDEIEAVREWVDEGGSLLLVVDHMPIAGAGADLAAAFGIEIANGFALRESLLPPLSESEREIDTAEAGAIVFGRQDGSLADHAVTRGSATLSSVDTVVTMTGTAFRLPPGAESVLTLGEGMVSLLPSTAFYFSQETPKHSVQGWSQGALLHHGNGRVAVFGEGMIVVPSEFVQQMAEQAGIAGNAGNLRVQNTELLVNVIEWLAGRLPEE